MLYAGVRVTGTLRRRRVAARVTMRKQERDCKRRRNASPSFPVDFSWDARIPRGNFCLSRVSRCCRDSRQSALELAFSTDFLGRTRSRDSRRARECTICEITWFPLFSRCQNCSISSRHLLLLRGVTARFYPR